MGMSLAHFGEEERTDIKVNSRAVVAPKVAREVISRVRRRLDEYVVGYDDVKDALCYTWLESVLNPTEPRPYILVYGPAGIGKTYMLKTTARLLTEELRKTYPSIKVRYVRITGHSQLMPEDILYSYTVDYNEEGKPTIKPRLKTVRYLLASKNPLPAILHVEEFDKIPTKTQTALLEMLEERQVTIPDYGSLKLNFIGVFSANTREFDASANPLARTVKDRFGMVFKLGYLPLDADLEILKRKMRMWEITKHVKVPEYLQKACVIAVKLTQENLLDLGAKMDYSRAVKEPAGPRAYLEMAKKMMMRAFFKGRRSPDENDYFRVGLATLRGRITIMPDITLGELSKSEDDFIYAILTDALRIAQGKVEKKAPQVSESGNFFRER